MLDRLMGTETEYAIRFAPSAGTEHPGNQVLFDHLTSAVRELVHVRLAEGASGGDDRAFFTENGGTFNFEQGEIAVGGLFEAGTPECRGPAQALLYQRAQDRLLTEALDIVRSRLRAEGIEGELGLLKNCRDALDNVYGAQESYEVTLASGPRLWAWRLGLMGVAPVAVVCGAVIWAVSIATLLLLLVGALGWSLVRAVTGSSGDDPLDPDRIGERFLPLAVKVLTAMFRPPVDAVFWAADLLTFRPYRRAAMGFFVSRPVLTGAGTLRSDGRFELSEKMGALRRVMRRTVHARDRGLFETGHLVKPVQGLGLLLQWQRFSTLFRARQRLQIGMSDANRCDVAEYLKLGTTALVLDMVDAGVLDDAPRPRRPVAAARALSADATLTVTVPLRKHPAATALALQRFYLERAETFVDASAAPVEAHQLVKLWRETLDALEANPRTLVGRLDWITKQALVTGVDADDSDVSKVVDLRYHELGPRGYLTWLDEAGLVTRLMGDAEVTEAMRTPPVDTPARQRGTLVKALSEAGTQARVGWERVRVHGPGKSRVLWLDEHRQRRRDPIDGD